MVNGVFVGLITIDLIYTVDKVPAPNAKIVARSQQVFAGGPATNAAITFRHLGGDPVLVAALGRHPLASIAQEELAHYAVELVDLAQHSGMVPPLSSVYVDRQGRRSVVSVNSTQTDIPSVSLNHSILDRADILLVDGHAMTACQSWAHAAHARGIPVVLDGGSWKPDTDQLLKHVDAIICSANFLPPGCVNPDEVIRCLRRSGVHRIAITNGGHPVHFVCDSEEGMIDVPHVEVVDTTGAGDVFHGAFCYFAVTGHSFVEALRRAANVAADSCRFHGTRQWMQTVHTRAVNGG